MRILYLYEEVMGYTIATIRALVARGTDVHVVHWDHKKLTPYQLTELPNVTMYSRSRCSVEQMKSLARRIQPTLTVVSGWNDKGYLQVAKQVRANGGKVVVALDGQWHGSAKQVFAAILGHGGYLFRYFSHAWVAGVCQFEYARRLGFGKEVIVHDLYSADLALFQRAYQENRAVKDVKYPHRFLFVGRFEPVKGLDILLDAWKLLRQRNTQWELRLIGSGTLSSVLKSADGVVVKDFMQPHELRQEVANAGCFVLPSRIEPWGVVVHECAASGLPLIVSDAVGAAKTFLIPGLNGFTFTANDPQSLARRMTQVSDSADQELLAMSHQSSLLSRRITPDSSAANLLSIVNS